MNKQVVVNASPLIFLSRGGHLDLLRHFGESILVPRPVYEEVRSKGSDDITAAAVSSASWLTIAPPIAIPDTISAWGLGRGESSVLAHVLALTGSEAIIDDLAARKCANGLDIRVRGTLGIVLVSRQRGLVSSARAVMEDLVGGGMYLSNSVLDAALKKVGE